MTKERGVLRWVLVQSITLWMTMLLALITASGAEARPSHTGTVEGLVESNGVGLTNYGVRLFAALPGNSPMSWLLLASTVTDRAGRFKVSYSVEEPRDGHRQYGQPQPSLFIEAVSGPVMLASAIGNPDDAPDQVVVNERTTVATGNAFAQFIGAGGIEGNIYGMSNAAHMAANLADPQAGEVGVVLASTPNGTETTTLATFNSLTNAVASCVAVASN